MNSQSNAKVSSHSWEEELSKVDRLEKVDFPTLMPLLLALADLKNLPNQEGINQFQDAVSKISGTRLLTTIVALPESDLSPEENGDAYFLWALLGTICDLLQQYGAAYRFFQKAAELLAGNRGHNDREVLALQLYAATALAHTGKKEESLDWLSGIQQDCEEGLWVEEENLGMIQKCRMEIINLKTT